jgi:hypothetical protein
MNTRAYQWVAPFLIAMHAPLFLFAQNVHAFLFQEVYATGVVAVVVAAVITFGIHRFIRDRGRTVCLAAGAVAWTCWYGLFSHALAGYFGIGPLAGGRVAATLIPWTLLWLLYATSVMRARSLDRRASSWLLGSLVLLAQPLLTLGTFVVQRPDLHAPLPAAVALQAPARPPDIIHFIFDRYASAGVLRARYAFDNSPLAQELRARGFFVADRSNANYFKTGLSLAATLNLTYLNSRFAGLERMSDWRPVYRLVDEHSVWRSLKPLGYEYVHLGSWWEPTRRNLHATENHSYARIPRFAQWLYEFTPLADLGVSLGGMLDSRLEQWKRIHRQLQDLERVRAGQRPVFVFVHFLLPHDPYVFGPGGEYLPADVVRKRPADENYVNHVRFANVAMIRTIDALMANTGRPRPIIIVQADEGPLPPRYGADTLTFDWRQATPDELREKFGILNAIYLPGGTSQRLYPAISPVNTYRVVFNDYFGAKLDLLPDRSFVSVGDRQPYQFIDITDVVAGEMAVPVRTSDAAPSRDTSSFPRSSASLTPAP